MAQNLLGLINDADYVTGAQLAQILAQALPNLDFGSAVLTTSGAGRVSFPNLLGDPAAKYVAWGGDDGISGSNGFYVPKWVSTTSTTVTVQYRRTDTGAAAASGQSVSLFWLGAV